MAESRLKDKLFVLYLSSLVLSWKLGAEDRSQGKQKGCSSFESCNNGNNVAPQMFCL